MGRVYAQSGESEKAEATFKQAIRMEKGDAPEYSCELAQLYVAEGATQKAIAVLREAEQHNPDRLDVRVALASAYLADKQYAVAIRALREVLADAPDSEPVRRQLEMALRASGRSEEADRLYADSEPALTRGKQ